MKRYWFEFDFENTSTIPYGTLMGCGVTAWDYNDAIYLLSEKVFKAQIIPKIKHYKENVDISTLDINHVIPNMISPINRGVWFPIGYNY